jgi:hypothetical protein
MIKILEGVRTEVSLIQTVFYDRLSESAILSIIGPRPDGLRYNSFPRSNGKPSGRLAETSLILSTSKIQLNVE